jgi:hypothetical protein
MSTTVTAEFIVPVGCGKQMVTAPMVPDFSRDFDGSFGPAYRAYGSYGGIVSIEARTGLARDTAGAAEATAAARADPMIPREALSSVRADASLAVANSGSMRTDALLTREFVASRQIHLMFRAEWLVAQRRENTPPAESLVRARADAVVRVEGAALLSLNPNMPTEQGSVAAALLLFATAESGALRSSNAILPAESLSGAAIKVDALLSVEALGATRRDAPVAGESWDTYVVRVTLTLSDGRVLIFATTATPTAATTARRAAPWPP